MINQEIVTYLKGEEKFNDDNFIWQWANYSSLIKADKDPGQYLPYLFVIYYFGPNKAIQDSAKELIEFISPKEILQFQDNFLTILKKIDAKLSAGIAAEIASDEDYYLDLDYLEERFGLDNKTLKLLNKEIQILSKSFIWGHHFISAYILPIILYSDKLSVSKLKLQHPIPTHYVIGQYLLKKYSPYNYNKYSYLKKSYIFLNYSLDGGGDDFSNHFAVMDRNGGVVDELTVASSLCHNFSSLIAITNLKAAAILIDDSTEGDGPIQTPYYEDIGMILSDALDLIDDELTYEFRLNHSYFTPPSVEQIIKHAEEIEVDDVPEAVQQQKKDIICITGRLNSFDTKAKAKEYLEKQGYEVRSTVTKDVTIVLNESGVESGKAKKARDNGVRIVISIDEIEGDHLSTIDQNKNVDKDSSIKERLTKKAESFEEDVKALLKSIRSEDKDKIPEIIKGISNELKGNKKIALVAVKKNGHSLQNFFKKIREDKEVVMAAAMENGMSLKHTSKELKDDKEVVMAAVKQYGGALEYVSKELKADKEVVMTAFKNKGYHLQYASDKLRNNKEVVMAAVRTYGGALQYAFKELKADKEVVMAAVKSSGSALQFASRELKADKQVVMVAGDLQYASKELKQDKEVVMAAVKSHGSALEYASEELQADKKIVMAAVKSVGRALKYTSKELKNDKEVVTTALRTYGEGLGYASEEFQADKKIVMAVVKNSGWALQFASKKLKNDKEVVMAAVKSVGSALQFASEKLKSDKEVVMAAVKNSGRALQFASEKLKSDKEVVMAAVKNSGRALQFASEKLKSDKEIVLIAVTHYKESWDIIILEHASDNLRNDKEVVMAAIKTNEVAFIKASKKLQKDKDVIALLKKHD